MTSNSYIRNQNNTLTVIPQGVVLKEYQNLDGAKREFVSLTLLRALNITNVPKVYGSSSDITIIENIANSQTGYDFIQKSGRCSDLISNEVAGFVVKVMTSYQNNLSQSCIPKTMSFEYLLSNLISDMFLYKKQFCNYFGKNYYDKLTAQLKQIFIMDLSKNLTLVHSDLHLSNVLFKKTNDNTHIFYVIDFEASCIGPIELEFQNSLFWNDAKSLNVKKIISILNRKYNIAYSTKLEKKLGAYYVASQIISAIKVKDYLKLKLIKAQIN